MCGLFAHLSTRDNCQFNWDKFNFLGVDNDERGGDSVGRLIGDQYSTFVSSKVKTSYYDYVIAHRNDEPSHIAIWHTRKASVGAVNIDNAQPIRLELEDGYFNMVHNGTIYNYTDLAKKYGVEHIGKTDSQVLAAIIKDHGFEVLKEFNGAAALIIKDDRVPDTLFVFKGESLGFNGKLSEERPLYYFQESEDSMYISSKEEGLYFIGGDADTVQEFISNTLYEIKEGVIINKTFYDRTKCNQNRVYTNTVTTLPRKIGFNNREDYDDYSKYYSRDSMYNNYPTADKHATLWNKDVLQQTQAFNIIQVSKLRYYYNSKLITGPINIDRYGIINFNKKKEDEYTLYFYMGVLLKNKEVYQEVRKELGKTKHFKETNENMKFLASRSVYPIGKLEPTYGDILKTTQVASYNIFFSGTINPLFSNKVYEVNVGSCTKIYYKQFW